MGIVTVLYIVMKFNNRNTVVPRLIAISWIIYSIKIYLDNSFYYHINLSSSILGVAIGTLLVVNFIDIFKINKMNIKAIFNLIFLNYSYGVYDIDKLYDCQSNVINICLNYFFIAINFLPILVTIQKKMIKLPININLYYPTPIALSTLTIFLNYFRDVLPIHGNYVMIVDILCYLFLIISYLADILVLKTFRSEHIFFLVLNVLNLIFIHYLDIFSINSKAIGISY
jgi:hypothetical protein